MKRITTILAIVAMAIATSACSSTGSAVIKKDEITGLKSHDAANAIKADRRAAEVESLTKNAKSIFKMEGIEGQPIIISGVKSIEVNVPWDPEKVLNRTTESQSEAVLMMREGRGLVRDVGSVALPIAAAREGVKAFTRDRELQSQERIANTQANAQLADRALDEAGKMTVLTGMDVKQVPLE